ncbi:hypothetical protein [Notoacmeibacter ruber]|uniref:CTP synthetase n=1 Tax=Notoacmeibacter ruber TaxID=2670375 RepID=A0A3L7JF89_9HYPH|nr:hypothetical protein [Notoacmeibacter ruber]RLQ89124.1 hypothetical protein D8780_13615 [Notoacmeibacter ruber]
MLKVTALIHVITMPVMMGIFVIAVLNIPSLYDAVGIVGAAAIGFLVAVPVSWFVARRIQSSRLR